MPEKKTLQRARSARRKGRSASTQAGEFVREEIHHIREGKHGAKSARQAIVIGLSKAGRAGVKLKPPAKGKTSEKTRKSAEQAYKKGQKHEPVSKTRSRARVRALKKERASAASHTALSRQAHSAAKHRTAAERSKAARKAVRTKGSKGRAEAAKKAAHTRARELNEA
ncbi:MAG: DNA-binding protein [Bacteroidetes bacterium]|nr:DNA-binding protein [Bacteroidota bacterium]